MSGRHPISPLKNQPDSKKQRPENSNFDFGSFISSKEEFERSKSKSSLNVAPGLRGAGGASVGKPLDRLTSRPVPKEPVVILPPTSSANVDPALVLPPARSANIFPGNPNVGPGFRGAGGASVGKPLDRLTS